MRATHTKPPMTPHKGLDRRNLDLVILANHITRQISIQVAMALGADIWTVVDGLVRVLMQSAVVAFMSRLCTARFGMLPTGFPVS